MNLERRCFPQLSVADPGPGRWTGRQIRGHHWALGNHATNGPDGTIDERNAETSDTYRRWHRGPPAAFPVPADLAGEPALQSRSFDPGGRRGLGHDTDGVL